MKPKLPSSAPRTNLQIQYVGSMFEDVRFAVAQAAKSAVCRDPLMAARATKVSRELFCNQVMEHLASKGLQVDSAVLTAEGMVTVKVINCGTPHTLCFTQDDVRHELPEFGPNSRRTMQASQTKDSYTKENNG